VDALLGVSLNDAQGSSKDNDEVAWHVWDMQIPSSNVLVLHGK